MFTTGLEGLLSKVAAPAARQTVGIRKPARVPTTPAAQAPLGQQAAAAASGSTTLPYHERAPLRQTVIATGPSAQTLTPAPRRAPDAVTMRPGAAPRGRQPLPHNKAPQTQDEMVAALRAAGANTRQIQALQSLDGPPQVMQQLSATRAARAQGGTVGAPAKGTPVNGLRSEAPTIQGGATTVVSRPPRANENVAKMTPQQRQQAAQDAAPTAAMPAARPGLGQQAAQTAVMPATRDPRKTSVGVIPSHDVGWHQQMAQEAAQTAARPAARPGLGQQAAQAAEGPSPTMSAPQGAAQAAGRPASTMNVPQEAAGAAGAGKEPGWWDRQGWKMKALGALGGGYLLSKAVQAPINTYEDDQEGMRRGAHASLPIY